MGPFDYLQFAFLILFYVLFLGRTFQLMSRGIRPIVLGLGGKGLKALLELAFFFGLIIWSVEVAAHSLALDFHVFPEPVYTELFEAAGLKIVAVVLDVAGFTIFTWALVSFGTSWRVGIDKQRPGGLVTSGVFARTRNPIFVFLDLYFVSVFLSYPNPFFLAFAVVTVAGIHIQILEEEKFLAGHYGDAYRDYRRHARRYF